MMTTSWCFPLTFLTKDSHGCPRCHDERDQERKHHRRTGPDRNWSHIWPHQATDKRKWQNGGNHSECCKNRRVSNFINSIDCYLNQYPILRIRYPQMPDDILDNHDGIVDKNTNRKYQCKECDSV